MNEVCVAKVRKGAWAPAVLEAMERLVLASDARGRTLLDDELRRCDVLYLASDADGLLAFLLVARVRLPVGAECRQARYLGLSALRQDRTGSEAAAAVYTRFAADAQLEEQKLRVRLPLFTTTATPFALRAAHSFWTDVHPAQDGSFPESLLPVASAAALWLGKTPSAPQAKGDRLLLFCSLPVPGKGVQAEAA